MSALFTVFSGPWAWAARAAMYALLIAAIVVTTGVKVHQHDQRVFDDYKAAQVMAAEKLVIRQGTVTVKVETKYVKVAGATQVITQYVDREVKDYAQKNTGSCIDPEFVRLLGAATADAVPDAAGGANAAGGTPAAPAPDHPGR